MDKIWLQMTIPVSDETSELVSSFLFESGANGVLEGESTLTVFFPSPFSAEILSQRVRNYLDELQGLGLCFPSQSILTKEIRDRDWNAEWKKSYGMTKISDRILIRPSWEKPPQDSPECTIEIDPEMAFGTGTHATTSLTLQLLERGIHGNERILDFGTGTGILSIAAVKLGAKKAIALDIDPVAAKTAFHNVMKNNVSRQIHIFSGSLEAVAKAKFDIIVANVNRGVILKFLPFMSELLDDGGKIILSGILDREETMIRDALGTCGLQVLQLTARDEWLAFEVEKQHRSQAIL